MWEFEQCQLMERNKVTKTVTEYICQECQWPVRKVGRQKVVKINDLVLQ